MLEPFGLNGQSRQFLTVLCISRGHFGQLFVQDWDVNSILSILFIMSWRWRR